jgi:hypothetical protein
MDSPRLAGGKQHPRQAGGYLRIAILRVRRELLGTRSTPGLPGLSTGIGARTNC